VLFRSDGDVSMKAEPEDPELLMAKLKASGRVLKVRHLLHSPQLISLLEAIESKSSSTQDTELASHDVIVKCNNMTVELENEIAALHKELTANFSKRFPELEKLVPNGLDFARTARRIGNETDLTAVDLSDILPSSILMVVTISGSTSEGQKLNEEELKKVFGLCDEMIAVDGAKQKILDFIQSKMDDLCPNVTAVVGSEIAARLVGIAGGVVQLSKLPASVVQVLGQRKDALHGLSTASIVAHQGFLHACDLVGRMPPSLRTKAVRLLSGKCTLAARIDSYRNCPNGSTGQQFRQDIEKRLEKLQEPPPAKLQKALPVPEDKIRKRRGGKRARAMKEKYALSEMQKMANRTKFGLPDTNEDFDPTVEDLGLLTSGTGKVRMQVKESKLGSKLLQKKRQAKSFGGGSGGTSGLSSSLAFTAVQGLELANPLAQTPKPDDKYFGTTTTFFHAPTRVKRK